MEKLAKQILIFALLTPLVWLICPVMSREVEDESEFNYDLNSENGPFHWGNIKPEWRLCNNGSMQSPIDLLDERVQISHLGALELNYRPSKATLKNRGHDIKLQWLDGTSSLQINGIRYVLQQFHWHSPSEHTIDGKRLDLELHMVHETPSGQTAVVAILYKAGRSPDLLLSSLKHELEDISDRTGEERDVGVKDPRLVQIGISKTLYYRYVGSLTTPPCTEDISWTIQKEVRSVTKEQIDLLRDAVHDDSDSNARPLQPINDRLVQFNKPKEYHH